MAMNQNLYISPFRVAYNFSQALDYEYEADLFIKIFKNSFLGYGASRSILLICFSGDALIVSITIFSDIIQIST